jgi:nitroreductase
VTTVQAISFRKPAEADHPIHELISERWSPGAFSLRLVERKALVQVFEAARWAPSAANQQLWIFIVVTQEDVEAHARFVSTLVEGNSVWARHAPVLIMAGLYEQRGKEQMSVYDVGMVSANVMTQAVALGLTTHQMGGFDTEKAHIAFRIPQGYQPLAMIALGYPGSVDALPNVLREREAAPRVRKLQQEFVFEGYWQEKQSCSKSAFKRGEVYK